MKNQQQFLNEFNLEKQDFEKTGLDWKALTEIHNDYLQYKKQLEEPAEMIFKMLLRASKVHSVRYRIKDPDHLIEKIIRKKVNNSKSDITLDNYRQEVTDLIGVRALHLFKEDGKSIDDYIRETWHGAQPVANLRRGDAPEMIDFYSQQGFEINENDHGYRSVHYLVETRPGKTAYPVEIQVRTIFEEACFEIDHTIRYPYNMKNQIFNQFLLILNRLAGSADEMGSFINPHCSSDMPKR